MPRWLIAALLLGLGASPAGAQFYSSLDRVQRERLAEDYYLAGSQYLAQGLEKGRDFQELARIMNPRIDPTSIPDVEQPSAADLLARGVAVAGPRDADTTAGIIRTRLLRFIGAVLTENAEAVAEALDGSVYLTDYRGGAEYSRGAARAEMETLFKSVSLRGVAPSRLYRLETLAVSKATPELAARGFADAYVADIEAAMDLSTSLPVWSMRQRFYFRHNGASWLIFAVGASLPPGGWKPAALQTEDDQMTAASNGAQERANIEASFLGCVARFLQKDRDGALRYFAPRVRLERLGATVARADLGTAFQSYFGTMDFGGLKTEDLVEPQSVFVVETDRFPELSTGRRYLLTVETRLDLAERIPFWTKFQEYYFAQIDGAWKIYAIF